MRVNQMRTMRIVLFCLLLHGEGTVSGVPCLRPAFANPDQWVSRWIRVDVTAYCPCRVCCGDDAQGITATGRDANLPGVAVDPDAVPLGSRVDIPSQEPWLLADDTGRLIRPRHEGGAGVAIDIRMQSHEEAKAYGRKNLRIRVWTRN